VLRLSPRQGAHSPFTLLNQQIADLTREVMHRKRAEQEALAAVRLRDEFVSIASHELKTPLHSLKLQLELIDRMLGTLDPLTSQRLGPKVDLLRRQVDRLGVLSNRLLDVSALRAGRMTFQPQPLALAPAVHAVVERVSSELEKAGCQLSLELEADTSAVLDPSRFEQILVNLLSNAAKYGAGQPIEISVRSTRDQVVLSVRDHGIGIAEEDLQRIFGKFERAISAENYGGLGLGLYITKQLVEGMDGHIRATSTVGRGSTFTVEFPRAGRPPGVQQ
jgi:signal transduction histidine kinase